MKLVHQHLVHLLVPTSDAMVGSSHSKLERVAQLVVVLVPGAKALRVEVLPGDDDVTRWVGRLQVVSLCVQVPEMEAVVELDKLGDGVAPPWLRVTAVVDDESISEGEEVVLLAEGRGHDAAGVDVLLLAQPVGHDLAQPLRVAVHHDVVGGGDVFGGGFAVVATLPLVAAVLARVQAHEPLHVVQHVLVVGVIDGGVDGIVHAVPPVLVHESVHEEHRQLPLATEVPHEGTHAFEEAVVSPHHLLQVFHAVDAHLQRTQDLGVGFGHVAGDELHEEVGAVEGGHAVAIATIGHGILRHGEKLVFHVELLEIDPLDHPFVDHLPQQDGVHLDDVERVCFAAQVASHFVDVVRVPVGADGQFDIRVMLLELSLDELPQTAELVSIEVWDVGVDANLQAMLGHTCCTNCTSCLTLSWVCSMRNEPNVAGYCCFKKGFLPPHVLNYHKEIGRNPYT